VKSYKSVESIEKPIRDLIICGVVGFITGFGVGAPLSIGSYLAWKKLGINGKARWGAWSATGVFTVPILASVLSGVGNNPPNVQTDKRSPSQERQSTPEVSSKAMPKKAVPPAKSLPSEEMNTTSKFNAEVFDPPSNCRMAPSTDSSVKQVLQHGDVLLDQSNPQTDQQGNAWYREQYLGCWIHHSQIHFKSDAVAHRAPVRPVVTPIDTAKYVPTGSENITPEQRLANQVQSACERGLLSQSKRVDIDSLAKAHGYDWNFGFGSAMFTENLCAVIVDAQNIKDVAIAESAGAKAIKDVNVMYREHGQLLDQVKK
jgi:hypothetical protein